MIYASIAMTLALLVFFNFCSTIRFTFKEWAFCFVLFFPIVLALLFSVKMMDDERAYQEATYIMRYKR